MTPTIKSVLQKKLKSAGKQNKTTYFNHRIKKKKKILKNDKVNIYITFISSTQKKLGVEMTKLCKKIFKGGLKRPKSVEMTRCRNDCHSQGVKIMSSNYKS